MKTTSRMDDETCNLIKTAALVFLVFFLAIKWRLQNLPISFYNGRYILLTGCDRGLGRQLAIRLDAMGFYVFAGCVSEKGKEELIQCCSNRLVAFTVDVTNLDSVEGALNFVKLHLPTDKGLWGLVNNVEKSDETGNPRALNNKDFDDTLAVNLHGVIYVTNTFFPLVKKEKGRIVNMTSVAGRFATGSAPFVVSKFGVEGYSACLRRDLYKSGVTVHTVEPGLTRAYHHKEENQGKSCDKTFDVYTENEVCKGKFYDAMEKVLQHYSAQPQKVLNAFIHALCARYPKSRYLVGYDANIVFRILCYVPECLTDLFLSFSLPVSRKMKNH